MSKKCIAIQIQPGTRFTPAFERWSNWMIEMAEKLNRIVGGGVSIGFHDHPDCVVITTWLYWRGRPVADIWFDRKLSVRIFFGNNPAGPEKRFTVNNERGIEEELNRKFRTVVVNEQKKLAEALANLQAAQVDADRQASAARR